mmetsp:Transcript_8060/g.9251  ORF Transcript_8060/g.9251 Transcript_8060/m.9251 type:complete len:224 (-) Transcript_8060:87-758(-)|eukprot:CAMPEP_0184037374 /NCGR_PEP_ID=MMETSP0955-20130417/38974_1 /TAXON_ID=627963 /ORGANISM="Aplanochytrium sp, Strain PBS07" /LENGTH=223 /DNA_ID=CAMNT_0026325459 /DNA_START=139 /DNA_END=810 /DNA_ORIENTATION=-
MVCFTYVARVTDGLMLVASMDSASTSRNLEQHKQDGKQLIRQLNTTSPHQCTIESGEYWFHYIIEGLVVYLALTAKSYPKRLAYLYLTDLKSKFQRHVQLEHGDRWESFLNTIDRPYAFIKFDKEIQRLRREYGDPNSRQSMSKLNSDLQEVQSIMKKNIQDVLGRGERLAQAAETSSNLVHESKRFSKGARRLNLMHFYKTYGPIAALVLVVLGLLYFRFFM